MSATPNQITFAKEVMISFKRIGLALLLSIVLFITLYFMLDWRKYNAGGIVVGQDMDYYHERQKEIFLDDVISKSLTFFIIFSFTLIVGRYISMVFKWVSRTSKLES